MIIATGMIRWKWLDFTVQDGRDYGGTALLCVEHWPQNRYYIRKSRRKTLYRRVFRPGVAIVPFWQSDGRNGRGVYCLQTKAFWRNLLAA